MKRLLTLPIVAIAILGCELMEPEKSVADAGTKTSKKSEDVPVVKESAWTWGYFFAAGDKASVKRLSGERQQSLALYRVDKTVPVRGKPSVAIAPGSKIVRVETAARLPATDDAKTVSLLFQGLPQHLQYTSQAQRDKLRSRAEFPASKDTIAVVILIRKSAEWWAMPHDQRLAHFQKMEGKTGHAAIGVNYIEFIHRKLYHTRYAVETTDHDFITYFEFERAHEGDFKALCTKLRDTTQNPEWAYVDREYEIWMTKLE
jgi:hypothetical protein